MDFNQDKKYFFSAELFWKQYPNLRTDNFMDWVKQNDGLEVKVVHYSLCGVINRLDGGRHYVPREWCIEK